MSELIELNERYAHLRVIEKDNPVFTISGREYKRRCANCKLFPDRGLEVGWSLNVFFLCRICAFTKHDAKKIWIDLVMKRQANPTGLEELLY